jgi:hypothetical protein
VVVDNHLEVAVEDRMLQTNQTRAYTAAVEDLRKTGAQLLGGQREVAEVEIHFDLQHDETWQSPRSLKTRGYPKPPLRLLLHRD